MRRLLLAALLAVTLVSGVLAETRGVTVTLRAGEQPGAPITETVKLYGSSHALVIGIDKYTGGWQRLRKSVSDARTVADELRRRGFQVNLKTDLDSLELQQTLKEFFAIKGEDPSARLLLWFSGHGHTLDGEGFLVPADAPLPTFVLPKPFEQHGSAATRHELSFNARLFRVSRWKRYGTWNSHPTFQWEEEDDDPRCSLCFASVPDCVCYDIGT